MAEAGFYWCGTALESDTASCFLCGKVLDGWESTDDPWSEHKKHSPQCAFVKLGRKEDELTVSYIYTTSMFIRASQHITRVIIVFYHVIYRLVSSLI